MNNKECEICAKMIKEKYKHYKTWRSLAFVFMFLTFLFASLFITNTKIFTKEDTKNDETAKINSVGNSVAENENNIEAIFVFNALNFNEFGFDYLSHYAERDKRLQKTGQAK